jgi:hypothetical protein
MLADMIDPSVIEEDLSTARDPAFDLYGAMAPEPPFDPAFIASYRAAQLARIRRITAFARRQIERGCPIRSSSRAPWPIRIFLIPRSIPTSGRRGAAGWACRVSSTRWLRRSPA